MEEGKDLIPKLEDYHVSPEFGFALPDPLEDLPEYFQPWLDLARSVHELLDNGTIRNKVREMPLLDHTRLEGHRQKRLAQLALSFIGNSYVWATGDNDVPKSVPKNLAVPWYGVSSDLGVKPHMNAVNHSFANAIIIDKTKPPSLGNFRFIFNFPGDKKQMDWFKNVMQMCEVHGAKGVQAVLQAQNGVIEKDEEAVTNALEALKKSLDDMIKTIQRTNDHFQVELFAPSVNNFASGWGVEGSPLVNGLIFEGVSSKPQKVIHYNEGQTPVFQVFDAVMGIEHKGAQLEFMMAKRDVMLPAHRSFIEAVEKGPSIRKFVMASSNEQLKNVMNACIKKISGFRTEHIHAFIRNGVVEKMKFNQEDENAVLENDPFRKGVLAGLKEIRDQTRNAVME